MEEISITLTKEQWEEVYQWFLCINDEYCLKKYEIEAAKKICETIYGEGAFSAIEKDLQMW